MNFSEIFMKLPRKHSEHSTNFCQVVWFVDFVSLDSSPYSLKKKKKKRNEF